MIGVIGDVVQDVVVHLEEEMRPATDTASTIVVRRGGSAANVAAFAARLHPTRFIGCVGDDLAGVAVTEDLERRGVDVRMQVRDTTGTIVVLIDPSGERSMFPSRGASACIGHVDDDWLEGVEILHLTGYSLQSEPSAASVLDAARRVKQRGGQVSFDVSSTGMIDTFGLDAYREIVRDIAPDVVSANADETRMLGLADADGAGDFLRDLAAQGDVVLLARDGVRPTRVFRGAELLASVPVQPADVVRDLTGAGDAFNAGFLAATAGGADPVVACGRAHDAARRVLAFDGASDGT